MIDFNNTNLTIGHVARHTPAGSGAQGRESAIIDIAQDYLIAYLSDKGMMNRIILKGGTAIRKLYAGKEGRFSLDLDFAVDSENGSTEDEALSFVEMIDGLRLGQFTFSISERRGKWYIGLESPFSEGEILKTKLDFSPSPWLEAVERSVVELPIHGQYGFVLPNIKTIRLEENMAEKIARLNRTNTARDLYDLNWIMENANLSQGLDLELLRRLVVLKIWVDSHGMHWNNVFWRPAHSPSTFDPNRWLNDRTPKDVDSEDIGTLAVPAPTAEELLIKLKKNYAFLMDLDETEQVIAKSNAGDKSLVLQTLASLPGEKLKQGLY